MPPHKTEREARLTIPAEARARWKADRVIVVDLGDRVVLRPVPDDPVGELIGKYANGPTTDDARRHARREDAETESRNRP